MNKNIYSRRKWNWTVSLLCAIGASFLIWSLVPLPSIVGLELPFSPLNRLLSILLVFLALWGIYVGIDYVIILHRQKQLLNDLKINQDLVPRSMTAETSLLVHRLQDALKAYGPQRLYQLPIYVLLGPPGAGKTSAIINSELEFPLLNRFGSGPISGIGGTRNLEWWLTSDAILLDTAGRYTTQDTSGDLDRENWYEFLRLLRKHRPRCPINGALVFNSLADFILQTDQEIKQISEALKIRIEELERHLNIQIPIYMVFTKCDLLQGFVDFFDNLGWDERAQVWGITFSLGNAKQLKGIESQFRAQFDNLLRQLGDRVLYRLAEEQDLMRRSLIFSFPIQFGALRDTLNRFVLDFSSSNSSRRGLMLRGVYFTSSTQEGTPIDLLRNYMDNNFSVNVRLPYWSGKTRGYFIHRLFQDVIFRDADLAHRNHSWQRW